MHLQNTEILTHTCKLPSETQNKLTTKTISITEAAHLEIEHIFDNYGFSKQFQVTFSFKELFKNQ